MAKSKRFRVLLEGYKGMDATGITIPFDVQEFFGTRARVPVRGTINGFPYRSSIFPQRDGPHYMVVNKQVRAGAKVKAGETVSFVMERDEEPRTVETPAELARAFRADKSLKAVWEGLSYTNKREHAKAIEEAKRPETRARRVEKALEALRAVARP
jgi:hypothetical protein